MDRSDGLPGTEERRRRETITIRWPGEAQMDGRPPSQNEDLPPLYMIYRPNALCTAWPISAGFLTTRTPAASRAFIFSLAVPLPPEMMAPAWPMRRPAGAVMPAMKL